MVNLIFFTSKEYKVPITIGIHQGTQSKNKKNYKITALNEFNILKQYGCNPIAFIALQSGGGASDGFRSLLEIKPSTLHQRSPFYVGSYNMVKKIEEFLKQYC